MKLLKSLKSRIILFTISIVTFSLFTTTILIKNRVETSLSKSLENNALNLLETVRINIKSEYNNILRHNKTCLDRKKSELKNHSEILIDMISVYYEKVKDGELSESKAKDAIFRTISSIKFDKNVGYFWIHSNDLPYPKMIYHTTIPELNGKILDDPKYQIVKGTKKNLFSEMTEICQKSGEGFVEYEWPKPTEEGLTSEQPKISYVKLFEPWNWIIGTGVYLDDIEIETNNRIKEIAIDLNNNLSHRLISESGYCFIFDEDNYMHVHPYLANSDRNNLIDPMTSERILEDIKKEFNSGNRFMDYMWDRIDDRDNFIYNKRLYITKFDPLDWYICVSVYKYDFEQDVRKLTNTIFLLSIGFLVISFILAIVISRSITSPLYNLMLDLEKTDNTGLPQKIVSKNNTVEIETLSKAINNMILSVKKSREALKNEHDFSMGIINGSPDIICGFRNNGTISFINPEGESLLEFKDNEIIGKNWWKMLQVNNDDELAEIIEKITENNQHNLEIKVETKSGKILTLLWNSINYKYKSHEYTEIFGICNNISDRKVAEDKLHFFQKYLHNIIDSMPSVIVGVDSENKITQWNLEAEKTMHITPDKAIGKYFQDIFDSLGLSKQLIVDIIRNNEPAKISKKNLYFNKENRYLDITIYPLNSESYEGAVIRIDDISDRVKLEEMMIQSEKMLSIGGLAAGMAHEINNPIAGMLQNAIVLENKLLLRTDKTMEIAREVGLDLDILRSFINKRKINKHLELIHSSGKKAAEIINNMLSFARKSESRFKYVVLSELIDSTINLLKNDYDFKKKYDFKKIKISKNYQKNIPKLKCEETKIQQVFINIFRNGAEAMNVEKNKFLEPEFIIGINYDDEMITIEMENNGPSIPLEIRKRIFEPFFTTKNIGEGTGLGLSVSYFIITKNHNGKMWVESGKNKNTKFIIELPYNKND